jgi:hypothetical protein
MKVLDGIAALFKFLLPCVSFALWDVNYRFHTTLTDNIVHDKILNKTYDIQSSGYPEYSCTGSTPCLSIGRNLPLRDLLEVANNDKLSMLQLSSAFCGPFPPSSVIKKFRQLFSLQLQYDPLDGIDGIYNFIYVERLTLKPFNREKERAYKCTIDDWCPRPPGNQILTLHRNISQMDNLRMIDIDPSHGSSISALPQELFSLKNLVDLKLSKITTKHQTFSNLIEIMGLSRSLRFASFNQMKFHSSAVAEFPPDFSLLKDTPLEEFHLECKLVHSSEELVLNKQKVLFNYSVYNFPHLKHLNICPCISERIFKKIKKNSSMGKSLRMRVGVSYWYKNKTCTSDPNTRCRWINENKRQNNGDDHQYCHENTT